MADTNLTHTHVIDEMFTPYQPKPGEPYMSEKQIAHFRQILDRKKKELLLEASRTVDHLQNEQHNQPDLNDRATQEEEFNLELRVRDRERKLLDKINKTLSQINKGDYGYCETCGLEIGLRRLEARPTATLCIDCKEIAELQEKHVKG